MELTEIRSMIDAETISVTLTPTVANPFMPGAVDGMRHWFCELAGGGVEAFDFYYSQSGEDEPDHATAVFHLLGDVKVYRGCPGYRDFLALMGLEDGEDRAELAVAWSELERLAPLVDKVADLANERTDTATYGPTP